MIVEERTGPVVERTRPNAFPAMGSARAAAVVVIGLLAAGVWLYTLTNGTTFFQDEWVWVLYRRGDTLATFLRPHNQHLSLVPLLIYRSLLATAGMRHYGAYRAIALGAHVACAALVYVYGRRRLGTYAGVLAAALIVLLGPAWGNILWPFQMAWLISLACGIAALLMLDRADRSGDARACALLAVSLASSGLGLPILLGASAELLSRRQPRRLWVVALPALAYGIWWLGYQQTGIASRLGLLPRFVADEVASSVAAVVGLAGNTSGAASGTLLTFGRPLAAVALVLLIARLVQLRTITPRVLGLMVIVGTFWVLTAVTCAYIGLPEAWASLYLYVGGLFTVLIALELLPGLRFPRVLAVGIGIATIAALISNAGAMGSGGRYLRAQGELTRAELGAIDLTRAIVSPRYVSLVPNFPFPVVLAGPYLAAERSYGTPAASAAQIAASSAAARSAADTELVQIHRVALQPRPAGGCAQPVQPAPPGSPAHELTLPANGLLVRARGSEVTVGVRRFADRMTVVGRLAPRTAAALRIGPDSAPEPWHVELVGGTSACLDR